MTSPARGAVESPRERITTPEAPKLEATARALVTGAVIGVVLAAGNVYTALKVGLIDGGNITAALLGFSLFATFQIGRAPYSALENNITQTTAASAAVMSFVAGLVSTIPALAMMGWTYPRWVVMSWAVAIAMFGIFVGALLRRRLIVDEQLPFPTGRATGELIETIYAGRHAALTRTRMLLGFGLLAAVVTWFRDGRPAFIPQGAMLPGTIAGVAATALTVGINWSPLMASTGAMLGIGTSSGMVLGGVLSWVILSPWLYTSGIVKTAEYGAFNSWLVWPALGLLIAGSFVPLLLEGGAIARSFRDLGALLRRRAPGQQPTSAADPSISFRQWAPLLAVSLIVLVAVGGVALGMPPLLTLGAMTLSILLANVSARAAGETDVGPTGPMGTVTLITLRNHGTAGAVLSGWLTSGMSSQTVPTLWAFKAGHRLGASPRAQVGAQILGAVLGAVVAVPVYYLIAGTSGLGTERMPAAAALSIKATAEAVTRGLGSLPPYATHALVIALVVGVALTLLGRTRFGRWVPSAAAIGSAMMLPFAMSMAFFAGAVIFAAARRLRPSFDEPHVLAAAAGGIAGESVMGVLIAILLALGRL